MAILTSLVVLLSTIASADGFHFISVGGANVWSSSSFTSGGVTYGPDRAVDGGKGAFWTDGTTFATKSGDMSPYMAMDMGGNYLVDSVYIHNRNDSCSGCFDRLHNILIEVYLHNPNTSTETPKVCGTIGSTAVAIGAIEIIVCPANTTGRFVLITKSNMSGANDLLQIVEVELTGYPACPCNFYQSGNICLFVSSFQTTFAQAWNYCRFSGSWLGYITHAAMNTFITDVLTAHAQSDQDFWIGVTNLRDQFYWRYILSGGLIPVESFTSPLVTGLEPNCTYAPPTIFIPPTENCAMISMSENGTWVWMSEQCNSEEYFICTGFLDV